MNNHAWQERVLLVYSAPLAEATGDAGASSDDGDQGAAVALTPPRQRGLAQYQDATALATAITTVLRREGVEGLLQVTWQEEHGTKRTPARVVITKVGRHHEAIMARHSLLGWRVMVTNAKASAALERSSNPGTSKLTIRLKILAVL